MLISTNKQVIFYYTNSEDLNNYHRMRDPFGLTYEFDTKLSTEKIDELLENVYNYDFVRFKRIYIYVSKDNFEILERLAPYLLKHLSFTKIYELSGGKIIDSPIVYSSFKPTPKLCLIKSNLKHN